MRLRLMLVLAAAGAAFAATGAKAALTGSAMIAREQAQELKRACGPSAPWHGTFSGHRQDNFIDEHTPYGDQGCFESERACRVWQQLSISVLSGGPIRVTSCRLE